MIFFNIIQILISIGLFIYIFKGKKNKIEPQPNTDILFGNLHKKLDDVPEKLLKSITGSVSTHKGKLAELIAYINLKSTYDRIIPLNNIVDFICIRFPTKDDPGSFDLIDIKNGKSARLSEDQRNLQKLIQSNCIKFLKLKIDTDEIDVSQNILGTNTDL